MVFLAYGAFNNFFHSWVANYSLGLTAWLNIKCPEPVIIWGIAITAMSTLNSWCLSASNDGSSFINLLTSNERLVNLDSIPNFFLLPSSATTAYQYYKINITIAWGGNVGIKFTQLYLYDT